MQMIAGLRTLRLLVVIMLFLTMRAHSADEFAVTGTVSFPKTGSLVVALITEHEFAARRLRSENPFILTIAPDSQQVNLRQVAFAFRHVPSGRYSVGCYQDVNGNAQLDVNLFGLPIEPWGVYQLHRPIFMPLSFEAVSFSALTEITNLQLEIR